MGKEKQLCGGWGEGWGGLDYNQEATLRYNINITGGPPPSEGVRIDIRNTGQEHCQVDMKPDIIGIASDYLSTLSLHQALARYTKIKQYESMN